MRVLHSKHQKLILQCYPAGKSSDKKPNSSELSYLLYYASTRRVKLEKVIEFLRVKTHNDVRGRKSGNLQVTLTITSALCEKCFENLNAFAPQVCSILSSILSVGELPLTKTLVATYGVFCSKLDNGLFAGDKEFVDSFSRLTSDLIKIGESQSSVETTNSRQWKMISLLACDHVFQCLGYSAQISRKFIPLCIEILTSTVAKTFTLDKLSARLNSNLNVERTNNDKLLNKVTSIKSSSQTENLMAKFEDDAIEDEDLSEEALIALGTLFHCTLTSQISNATRSIVDYDLKHNKESPEWGIIFLQNCASYIPVQLRFETLLTLLNTLSKISENETSISSSFQKVRHYSKYVEGMVSSNFSMIGLSISDVLSQLLGLQTNLYLNLSTNLTTEQVDDLSTIYSQCICNLSTHIYYFDQVSDSVDGILLQIDSILIMVDSKKVKRTFNLVLNLLSIISRILSILSTNSSAISWSHATLENWDSSFQLLNFGKSYSTFTSYSTLQDIRLIQKKYLEVFQSFLSKEMVSGRDLKDQNEGVNGSPNFLQPNNKNYIEDRENVLTSLLIRVEEYFEDPAFDPMIAMSLARALQLVAQIHGINFLNNFQPFFREWQLRKYTKNLSSVAKDLTAYLLLSTSLVALNENYKELLDEDFGESTLSSALYYDIQQRQELGIWTISSSSPETAEAETSPNELKSQLTLTFMEDFFAGQPIEKWLFTSNSILLEFDDGEIHRISQKKSRFGFADDGDDVSDTSGAPFSGSRLGLGTANDITSIYSGLNGGGFNGNSNLKPGNFHTPDTSQITQDSNHTHRSQVQLHQTNRLGLVPRVEDLKNSVNGLSNDDGNFKFHMGADAGSPVSVVQKQIHTTDVESILQGLKCEDDIKIVV